MTVGTVFTAAVVALVALVLAAPVVALVAFMWVCRKYDGVD